MESNFARAVIEPSQPVIIGVRMKPYALCHSLILAQIDSAFTSNRFPIFEDLIAAAFVCAHSWEENNRLLRSHFRRWIRLKLWGAMAGKFNIAAATVSMLQYVSTGDVYPDTEPPKDTESMRELSAPHSARLYLFLRASGFSESEAWNMPLNAANWLHAAKAEEEGKITLMSSKRRKFLEIARQERLRAEREEVAA